MDIHKWLEETADAKAPADGPSKSVSNFFQPVKKAKPVFEHWPAPERSKSDSSLLDPQPLRRAPPRKHKLSNEKSGEESASGASQPQDESTGSEASSHRYARKPRRKTRPDRYEPSPERNKARGKHIHASRKSESKKTRRKSKRKKEEPGGIGQTFQAKNVTRDRLTVRAAVYAVTGAVLMIIGCRLSRENKWVCSTRERHQRRSRVMVVSCNSCGHPSFGADTSQWATLFSAS
jgi:hypothetical protein